MARKSSITWIKKNSDEDIVRIRMGVFYLVVPRSNKGPPRARLLSWLIRLRTVEESPLDTDSKITLRGAAQVNYRWIRMADWLIVPLMPNFIAQSMLCVSQANYTLGCNCNDDYRQQWQIRASFGSHRVFLKWQTESRCWKNTYQTCIYRYSKETKDWGIESFVLFPNKERCFGYQNPFLIRPLTKWWHFCLALCERESFYQYYWCEMVYFTKWRQLIHIVMLFHLNV